MYFRYFHRPFTAFRSRLVVLSLRVIRQAVAHPFHVEIAHMCECHGSIHTLFSLCPWSQPRAVPIVVAETYRHPIVPGWRPQRQAAAAASTPSSCPLVLLLVGRLVLLESSLPHRATISRHAVAPACPPLPSRLLRSSPPTAAPCPGSSGSATPPPPSSATWPFPAPL